MLVKGTITGDILRNSLTAAVKRECSYEVYQRFCNEPQMNHKLCPKIEPNTWQHLYTVLIYSPLLETSLTGAKWVKPAHVYLVYECSVIQESIKSSCLRFNFKVQQWSRSWILFYWCTQQKSLCKTSWLNTCNVNVNVCSRRRQTNMRSTSVHVPPPAMIDVTEQAVCLSVCLHHHPGNSARACTNGFDGSSWQK